jgi:hypothetical protein
MIVRVLLALSRVDPGLEAPKFPDLRNGLGATRNLRNNIVMREGVAWSGSADFAIAARLGFVARQIWQHFRLKHS